MKHLTPVVIALIIGWLYHEYKRPIVIKIAIHGAYDGDVYDTSENGVSG